jgi:hypothetical protein
MRRPSIQTIEMTPGDIAVLNEAMRLLGRFAPKDHAHVLRVLREVHYAPELCPTGSLGCTGPHIGLGAAFTYRPSERDVVESAITLRHEGHHIQVRADGSVYYMMHTCGACDDFEKRLNDRIYAADAKVRIAILEGQRSDLRIAVTELDQTIEAERTAHANARIALEAEREARSEAEAALAAAEQELFQRDIAHIVNPSLGNPMPFHDDLGFPYRRY